MVLVIGKFVSYIQFSKHIYDVLFLCETQSVEGMINDSTLFVINLLLHKP